MSVIIKTMGPILRFRFSKHKIPKQAEHQAHKIKCIKFLHMKLAFCSQFES